MRTLNMTEIAVVSGGLDNIEFYNSEGGGGGYIDTGYSCAPIPEEIPRIVVTAEQPLQDVWTIPVVGKVVVVVANALDALATAFFSELDAVFK